MNKNSIIELKNINQHFEEDGRKIHVLKDINLSIQEKEFLILLGPSGSGKSTLLRVMAKLLAPSSGRIITKTKRAGFIFQNFALMPWLTVEENISFGLTMANKNLRARQKITQQLIKEVGLQGFEKTRPRELSGGMKQRVGIARALAIEPDIIFLDEPFSALDSFTAEKLRQDLLALWRKKKLTMVMVTHLTEEAVLMADRVAVLSPCPARIETIVENPLQRPRNPRSQNFFKLVDQLRESVKY